ncbi:MAG: hypothetical protein ABIK26_00050 [Candidatus Omnitrophota bacterium]
MLSKLSRSLRVYPVERHKKVAVSLGVGILQKLNIDDRINGLN